MKYKFELRSPVQTTIIESPGDQIVRGYVAATDTDTLSPSDAAIKIIEAYRPDLVEDGFDHLAPVFTVERNQDGTFSVEVDTHGLVDASIELAVI